MGKLDEVTYLVEWPVVLEGSFDERYLLLPPRVPITAMQSHQRYFPVAGEGGGLAPRFLFVANGALKPEIVIGGNEEVLVGRLEDASFAYERDLDRGIEAMLCRARPGQLPGGRRLAGRQDGAGRRARGAAVRPQRGRTGRADRAVAAGGRAVQSRPRVAPGLGVLRPAGLRRLGVCPAGGRAGAGCAAVEEHYMPVDAGGALPVGEAGALLSVADKVDTIAVGVRARASSRPAAAIPTACGVRPPVVAIVLARGYELGLPDLLGMSVAAAGAPGAGAQAQAAGGGARAVAFILDRVEPVLLAEGVTVEEVRAARGAGHVAPVPLAALARALRDDAGRRGWSRCATPTAAARGSSRSRRTSWR